MEKEQKDLEFEDIPGVSCAFNNALRRMALAIESSSVIAEPSTPTACRLLRRGVGATGDCTVGVVTLGRGVVDVATPTKVGATGDRTTGVETSGGGVVDVATPTKVSTTGDCTTCVETLGGV